MSKAVEAGRIESTNGATEPGPKGKAKSKPTKPKAEREAKVRAEPESVSEPAEAAPPPRTGGVRLSRPVLVLAGVVLVLALATSVTFAVLLGLQAATDRAGAQALATARAYASP